MVPGQGLNPHLPSELSHCSQIFNSSGHRRNSRFQSFCPIWNFITKAFCGAVTSGVLRPPPPVSTKLFVQVAGGGPLDTVGARVGRARGHQLWEEALGLGSIPFSRSSSCPSPSPPPPPPFPPLLLAHQEAAGCAGDWSVLSASAKPKQQIDDRLQM